MARAQVEILRQGGYDVDFFDLDKRGGRLPFWAKLLVTPIRLGGYVPVVRALRRGRYDWLHIHFISQGVVGLAVQRPFFVQAHGSDLHLNFTNPLLRRISRHVMRRACGIFYVTPNLLPFLKGFESKSYLLPNPIEPRFFAVPAPPAELRNLLIFTRLDPVKGSTEVFNAVESLAQIVRLSAIAWGPLASAYRRRYGHLVTFLDPVAHADVPALLAQYDGVIGQMRQGVLGLSELEALAASRVVFARLDRSLYPADPPPVVNVDTAASLEVAVQQVRADLSRVGTLTAAGSDWVRRNHSFAAHLEVLRSAYARR